MNFVSNESANESLLGPKVSICVPTFERVGYLKELIESFERQEYRNVEMCISDDSRSDDIRDLVDRISNPKIRYMHNPVEQGLWTNLLNALAMAQSDLAVIMGDDDLLSDPRSITAYAAAAVKYPDAQVFYSNQFQINESGRRVFIYSYFKSTTEYDAGVDAVTKLWYRSVQIAGLGFKVIPEQPFHDLFPRTPTLYPQMVATGRLLAAFPAVGIADFACSVRGHSEQLGAYAARELLVNSSREKLAWAELLQIINELADESPTIFGVLASRLEYQALLNFAGALPYIRLNSGRTALRRVVHNVYDHSHVVRRSFWFRSLYFGVMVVPRPILQFVNSFLKKVQVMMSRRTIGAAQQIHESQ
jgi:hypothetical protein